MKNIGYHTRLYGNNSVKVTGGSFGGSVDAETVERISRLFTVTVKPSGRAVFVDHNGREVSLYFSIDPETTTKGKEAIAAWRKERSRIEEERKEQEEELSSELESLVDAIGIDAAIRKLRGED